jgi:hypothetical protein
MVVIKATTGKGRDALIVLLLLWGLGGMGVTIFSIGGANAITTIALALIWIGGTLLFGFFAVLATISFEVTGPVPIYGAQAPAPPQEPFR